MFNNADLMVIIKSINVKSGKVALKLFEFLYNSMYIKISVFVTIRIKFNFPSVTFNDFISKSGH